MSAPKQADHARELNIRRAVWDAGTGQSFRCHDCLRVVRVVGPTAILFCPYCGTAHDTRRDTA